MADTKRQMEDVLKELGSKLDRLIEEAKEATGEIREDMEETIVKLKAQRDELEKNLSGYKEKSKEKWQEAKPHFTKAVDELKAAMSKIFK